MLKYILTSLLVIIYVKGFSQVNDKLTANEILDLSIKFCGGEERISKVKTCESSFGFLGADTSFATITEKRIQGKKFSQSIFSKTHTPQTTFFNGKEHIVINGSKIIKNKSSENLEAMQLKSYFNLQYGYKTIGFKLEKLLDQKFNNFDCYVIEAKSKNGYSTINFFDKTNYRLLMVVYPNGNKSLMIEYEFKDQILYNTLIFNTFPDSRIDKLKLLDLKTNTQVSDLWFNCPYSTTISLPNFIKVGKFEAVEDKSKLERTDFYQIESFDKTQIKSFLKWVNEDSYVMITEKDLRENNKNDNKQIFVRVISWNENGYVCHFLVGDGFGSKEFNLLK